MSERWSEAIDVRMVSVSSSKSTAHFVSMRIFKEMSSFAHLVFDCTGLVTSCVSKLVPGHNCRRVLIIKKALEVS